MLTDVGSSGSKALPEEVNAALREILLDFVSTCDNPTEAARTLGITHATVSFLLDGSRGFGGRTIAALQRVRPGPVSAALGTVTPRPAPVGPGDAGDAVDASRERAVRAYLELHPEATEAEARELSTWAQLANLEDLPRSAPWWLRAMDRAAEIRLELLTARR